MSFADELRQQAVQKVFEEQEKERRELEAVENAKKEFYAKRHAAIFSGEAVDSFYADLKEKLMNLAERCVPDDSKRYSSNFIYLPGELSQKETYYKEIIKEKTEYYNERMECYSDAEASAIKSVKSLYYDNLSFYKAFSEEECDAIEQQIRESLSKDGLRCSFNRTSVERYRYEAIELGRWRKCREGFIGYTLSVIVKWYPWDTSKAISAECLEKIRRYCLDLQEENLLRKKRPKLLANLGLENAEIYLCDDETILGSGKEGYAITPDGIYSIKHGYVRKQSYQELADERYTPFEDIRNIVRDDLM